MPINSTAFVVGTLYCIYVMAHRQTTRANGTSDVVANTLWTVNHAVMPCMLHCSACFCCEKSEHVAQEVSPQVSILSGPQATEPAQPLARANEAAPKQESAMRCAPASSFASLHAGLAASLPWEPQAAEEVAALAATAAVGGSYCRLSTARYENGESAGHGSVNSCGHMAKCGMTLCANDRIPPSKICTLVVLRSAARSWHSAVVWL